MKHKHVPHRFVFQAVKNFAGKTDSSHDEYNKPEAEVKHPRKFNQKAVSRLKHEITEEVIDTLEEIHEEEARERYQFFAKMHQHTELDSNEYYEEPSDNEQAHHFI